MKEYIMKGQMAYIKQWKEKHYKFISGSIDKFDVFPPPMTYCETSKV